MKAKNYFIVALLCVGLLLTSTVQAQEEKKYQMVEVTFMLPKVGMEKAFEKGVKSHNEAYHKDGNFKAHVDYIMTGKKTGWYAWIMGPCTFTDLDSRPKDDAHDKDWDQKVAQTIAKYGSTEYWKHNPKLSYSSGDMTPTLEEIWFVGLKRGDYYRFKELMNKIKAAFEKKGEGTMQIYDNQFNESNGRDIAIVWGMKNWAELDNEDASIKKEFEEVHGEGTWQNAMDEWTEITESIVSQLWKTGI